MSAVDRGASASRGSITLSRLTLAYDRHAAVEEVDGCFEAGSLTAVVGPNGAGKSTLVKSLVGILAPASGRIARDGIAARDLAYLPQAAEVDRSFPITVDDTVPCPDARASGLRPFLPSTENPSSVLRQPRPG